MLAQLGRDRHELLAYADVAAGEECGILKEFQNSCWRNLVSASQYARRSVQILLCNHRTIQTTNSPMDFQRATHILPATLHYIDQNRRAGLVQWRSTQQIPFPKSFAEVFAV